MGNAPQQEIHMKHLMIATVASLGLITAAAATSTTTTTTGGAAVTTGTTSGTAVTTGSASGTVVIQPEVRTKVKQYVTTSKPKAATVPSGFTVRRGVALPEAVEIQTFP